jgi:quercetin dioxygenase-like cupin family protein
MAGMTTDTNPSDNGGSKQLIDLVQVLDAVADAHVRSPQTHRRSVLFGDEGPRLSLHALEPSARMERHTARGPSIIHVIQGLVEVKSRNDLTIMQVGRMLRLSAGSEYDVNAGEASRLLITECLEE